MHLGIDLGTTNSLAAIFADGQSQLIPNATGHLLTPSAVSVDHAGHLLVGIAALERQSTHPELTATAFKRAMGTDQQLRLGSRSFRPEELSALVLGALKADAERHCGHAVSDAVITVPAYFNQVQREATLSAAKLAGLRVERLLNEPTAAGLAYGLQERADNTTFLVFDLGGGTFDVSVLEYFHGVVQVRASAGDSRLGGEDFAAALANLAAARCDHLSEAERRQLRSSGAFRRAAEQAKRDLTDRTETELRLVHAGAELRLPLTREDFEQASADLVQRLRRPIERALRDSRLRPEQLDEIILVGGATRMPLIRQVVARLFQRLPLRTINPDETIARGAAIQAALVARDSALEDVVLTDVMPFSLGTVVAEEVNGGLVMDRYSPIIERNTPVPVSRMAVYATVRRNQGSVTLDIRQGESPVGSENLHLGKLDVRVPRLPAGEALVEVRLSYDANGLLEVDAHSMADGHRVSTLIERHQGALDSAQIQQSLERLRALKVHPRDEQQNRYLLERARRLYEDRLGPVRELIQRWVTQFESVLDSQDPVLVESARAELQATLDEIDDGYLY